MKGGHIWAESPRSRMRGWWCKPAVLRSADLRSDLSDQTSIPRSVAAPGTRAAGRAATDHSIACCKQPEQSVRQSSEARRVAEHANYRALTAARRPSRGYTHQPAPPPPRAAAPRSSGTRPHTARTAAGSWRAWAPARSRVHVRVWLEELYGDGCMHAWMDGWMGGGHWVEEECRNVGGSPMCAARPRFARPRLHMPCFQRCRSLSQLASRQCVRQRPGVASECSRQEASPSASHHLNPELHNCASPRPSHLQP